jgi:hypothetical protein
MPEEENISAVAALLAEFNTKINDIEERHNLLKEKVLLLSQSFLKESDRSNKELALIKSDIRDIKIEVERTKEALQHIITESAEFARKEELAVLQKYMKIWDPLKFVKEEDVQRMIDEALSKKSPSNPQTKTL